MLLKLFIQPSMFKLLENENLDAGTVGFIYKVSYGPTEASMQNRLMCLMRVQSSSYKFFHIQKFHI